MKEHLFEKARERGYLKKEAGSAISQEEVDNISNYPFLNEEQAKQILSIEEKAIDYQCDVIKFFEEVIFNKVK